MPLQGLLFGLAVKDGHLDRPMPMPLCSYRIGIGGIERYLIANIIVGTAIARPISSSTRVFLNLMPSMRPMIGSAGRFQGFQGLGPSKNWNVRITSRVPQHNASRTPAMKA